jgi:UDP-GlcNAc3NAcA epimerase
MPEEINRILSDRISNLLLCPTQLAVDNLAKEGISEGVHLVGDVMFDAVRVYAAEAVEKYPLEGVVGQVDNYVLFTLHRAENTDHPQRLHEIFRALADIADDTEVVLPVHPRTRQILGKLDLGDFEAKLNVIEPVSYGGMLALEQGARAIITDSGGLQKEAFFHGLPCITLRDETEWLETVELGWNRIVGADYALIMAAWRDLDGYAKLRNQMPYGDSYASEAIANLLLELT